MIYCGPIFFLLFFSLHPSNSQKLFQIKKILFHFASSFSPSLPVYQIFKNLLALFYTLFFLFFHQISKNYFLLPSISKNYFKYKFFIPPCILLFPFFSHSSNSKNYFKHDKLFHQIPKFI